MRVQIKVTHKGQTYSGEVELYPADTEKTVTKPYKIVTSTIDIVTKPSAAVELLHRNGFFKESHKLSDVSNELRNEGYNFSRQSIFMALKAATFLALTGKRGSYSFVQKFPPLP